MAEQDWLSERFAEHQDRLRAMAYRMLGSPSEAEDAVQEAWLRVSRADASAVENLAGWLTTIVARVCLNMLEARRSRPEDPAGIQPPERALPGGHRAGPEDETLLADSVGVALLVVLDTLTPAERLAFVLHDMFAMPFTEVGAVLGRSPEAARQLASRARRRVQGASSPDQAGDITRQREVAAAYLAAARGGDFSALIALLDSDVTLTSDAAATPAGRAATLRGAELVAKGAVMSAERAGHSRLAL